MQPTQMPGDSESFSEQELTQPVPSVDQPVAPGLVASRLVEGIVNAFPPTKDLADAIDASTAQLDSWMAGTYYDVEKAIEYIATRTGESINACTRFMDAFQRFADLIGLNMPMGGF